jgi:DNA polymerase-3 subunit alpha
VREGLGVQIAYRNACAQGELRLGDAWRVRPTDELLAALRTEFSGSSVQIVY